jgi:negative elongation factor E
MVYIHFPSNLTEEELMLQTKYQKLKKKKKAIQALKTPKNDSEKPLISKRPADARDAREVARKLLKSGSIQPIQKPQTKQDQTSFKRPKGQERKRPPTENNVSLYHPFNSQPEDTPAERETSSTRIHDLYQQYKNLDREERDFTEKKPSLDSPSSSTSSALSTNTRELDKTRPKNTICISGQSLTEEYLKRHFNKFGSIALLSMEIEKGRGFITYSEADSSEKAIADMDGKTIEAISLQVQLARRQPKIERINNASASPYWATLATSNSPKGNVKDTREILVYDDNFFSS